MASDPIQTADQHAQYIGPDADAKAVSIDAILGTDDETTADVIWLLRYTLRRAAQVINDQASKDESNG